MPNVQSVKYLTGSLKASNFPCISNSCIEVMRPIWGESAFGESKKYGDIRRLNFIRCALNNYLVWI